MTAADILFNLYEYRTGVFLLKAYVVSRKPSGELDRVHHSAKAASVANYGIEMTDTLARALHLVDALRPANVAGQFSKGTRSTTTLPGLLSRKSPQRNAVLRHIDHRAAELLGLCKVENWPVAVNLNVRGCPEDDRVQFSESPPTPEVSLSLSGNEWHCRIQLSHQGGKPRPVRYNTWKILTQQPAPGWLLMDRALVQLSGLTGSDLKPFLTKDEVIVPAGHPDKFWRDFIVRIAGYYPIQAVGFDYREISQPTGLQLEARYHSFEKRYLLYPGFCYGAHVFRYGDPQSATVLHNTKAPYSLTRIVRNPSAEKNLLTVLESYPLQLVPSLKAYETVSGGPFTALRWLLETTDELEKAGVKILPPLDEGRSISAHSGTIEIAVTERGDWLELNGIITVGQHSLPFAKFVRYLQRGEPRYPLPDGTLFLIPEAWFSRYQPALRFARASRNGVRTARVHAPLLRPLNLDNILEDQTEAATADYQPSASLKATLRPYQLAGACWLINHYHQGYGAVLADDMGLGKTLQAIATLLYAKEQSTTRASPTDERSQTEQVTQMDLFSAPSPDEDFLKPLRALIVLPASLVYNWRHELQRFAPSLSVQAHIGTKRSNDGRILRRFDVILTTYQTMLRDVNMLSRLNLRYIILDESQYIKNRQSKVFRAINVLKADNRISLSGTPIENSLSDLWSQMHFTNPGLLGDFAFFKREFIVPIEEHGNEDRKEQLRTLVNPHILRRSKKEVAPDLPALDVQVCYCEMTEEQTGLYERERSSARNALLLQDQPSDGQHHLRVIAVLTRLRQIANHPRLLQNSYEGGSAKFTEALAEWSNLREAGHKVLIFSSMVRYLELFRAELEKRQARFAWLTGEVDAVKRQMEVQRFQENSEIGTFFISIKAGGTGLNLTAADYVFILDPWWNPATEEQAIARAHRIGRTGKVVARKFIVRGTVEEKILQLQQRKQQLSDDVLARVATLSFDAEEVGYLLE